MSTLREKSDLPPPGRLALLRLVTEASGADMNRQSSGTALAKANDQLTFKNKPLSKLDSARAGWLARPAPASSLPFLSRGTAEFGPMDEMAIASSYRVFR
ncbi:MAG TPA: hypothetical protein VKZ53_04765 [Candidatus Angelobacter sp.]|nr:hypothetical protein [Candidatus Angelobacter sp.]